MTLKEWIVKHTSDGSGGNWVVYKIDVAGSGIFRDTAFGPMWLKITPDVELTEEEKILRIEGFAECLQWLMDSLCDDCGEIIPKERLEALPHTRYCVKCAVNHPPPTPDPNVLCAKASVSCQNGFAPNE